MCIAFFTTTQPGYKLIIAANRDEFFDRPSTPADWHDFGSDSSSSSRKSESDILSGRDLAESGGGAWLGMTRDLRLGLITNIRDPNITGAAVRRPGAPSRGRLLRSFLESPTSASPIETFIDNNKDLEAYDGFNLLLFHVMAEGAEIGYISNRPEGRAEMLGRDEKGTRGLSNTPMEKPWPKVRDGQTGMDRELQEWSEGKESEEGLVQRLFGLLRQSVDIKSPLDAQCSTCIQPIIIDGRWYGTRVSTVILISDKDEVTFVERHIGGLRGEVGSFLDEQDKVYRFPAKS